MPGHLISDSSKITEAQDKPTPKAQASNFLLPALSSDFRRVTIVRGIEADDVFPYSARE
jgi:hypothetical protein